MIFSLPLLKVRADAIVKFPVTVMVDPLALNTAATRLTLVTTMEEMLALNTPAFKVRLLAATVGVRVDLWASNFPELMVRLPFTVMEEAPAVNRPRFIVKL